MGGLFFTPAPAPTPTPRPTLRQLCAYFAKLGWLAFGGPVAQIGLMHLDCVERRRWLDEDEFLRALNFCHVLPGPEALQLAIYIGFRKRSYLGGVLAGLLFILPGYLTLTALAAIYVRFGSTDFVMGVLWGFRPVALALIAAALWRIARAALRSWPQVALAAAAFLAFHVAQVSFILVLLACGGAYWLLRRHRPPPAAAALLAAAAPPWLERVAEISWFFLKVGLFSFGGAYAALPYMRQGAVRDLGWLTDAQMIDGLALGETTPGPLISIGVFVGFLAGQPAGVPWLGASAAGFFLFLPSFAFVLLGAPHVEAVTRRPGVNDFLTGVTAGVVGLMGSVSLFLAQVAFTPGGRVDPWTIALGAVALAVLVGWKHKLNVVAVVLAGGALGLMRALLPG